MSKDFLVIMEFLFKTALFEQIEQSEEGYYQFYSMIMGKSFSSDELEAIFKRAMAEFTLADPTP
jgi:hypothetical protein